MCNTILLSAIERGDLRVVREQVGNDNNLLGASLTADGETALHIAAVEGQAEIIEWLVSQMTPQQLIQENRWGRTALSCALPGGDITMIRPMVDKNAELLTLKNDEICIPVVEAASYGHVDLVRYMYHRTPPNMLDPIKVSKSGILLLGHCVTAQIYGT